MAEPSTKPLRDTPLAALHERLGGRMVGFAGYRLPVQYADGVLAEHLHTRAAAGLFDVSHMGQVLIEGAGAAEALERLVPQSVAGLAAGRQRYGFFTDDSGGILDDLMIARLAEDRLYLVVNAACKAADLAHLRAGLPGLSVAAVEDRALLALQGPASVASLADLVPGVAAMRFMDHVRLDSAFGPLWISRAGYTGEDGAEISVAAEAAEGLAEALLAMAPVAPIGLGARDSLRLEAGLCLYGQDIDTGTDPVEAGLAWAIQPVRRAGGARAGGFPGAERISAALESGPARLRVGLLPEGRAPMRAGTVLFETEEGGAAVGAVTSGAFGPSVGRPISMGFVPAERAEPETLLYGAVRGRRLPVRVAALPFYPHSYRRREGHA